MIGKFVVIRTYSAGVHCGYLEQQFGTSCILRSSRNIWEWNGANTVNEIALRGVAEQSRISEPIPEALFTEMISCYPCTPEAQKNLEQSRWNT